MKYKFLIIIASLLLLIPAVSAWEFDDSLSYSEDERTAIITNAFGFGEVNIRATLTSHENIHKPLYVNPGERVEVMQYFICNNQEEDYPDIVRDIEIKNMKTMQLENKPVFMQYATTEFISEDILDKSCQDIWNATNQSYSKVCETEILGTRLVSKDLWHNMTSEDDLPAFQCLKVRLLTEVKTGDHYDGVFTIGNKKIIKHATWTSNLNTGLLAAYKLNATSGAVVDSLNNFSGSLVDGTRGVPGIINNSFQFDGSDDWATIPDIPEMEGDVNITIVAWMNYTAAQTNKVPLADPSNTNWKFLLRSTGKMDVQMNIGGGVEGVSGTTDISDSLWHMLVGRYNGTHISLFLDGVLDADFAKAGNFTTGVANISFGSFGGADFWAGRLDEVLLYGRALTATEILALYNNGTGLTFQPIVDLSINITFPEAIFYNASQTNLNYSVEPAAVFCWQSNDSGVTNSSPVSAGINFTGLSSSEGSNTWNVYCNDSMDIRGFDSVTFTIDSIPPDVNITNPLNITLFKNLTTTNDTLIILNWTVNDTNLDTCRFSNNSGVSNFTVTCLDNGTIFNDTFGSYRFDFFVNDSADNKNSSSVSATYSFRVFVRNETFTASTIEGAVEDFFLNITLGNQFSFVSAILIYNNTDFATTSSTSGQNVSLSRTLVVPDVNAATNLTLLWQITLNDSSSVNTTAQNQSVSALSLDNCTTNTVLVLNYTMQDEDDQNQLNGAADNTTIEIDIDITSFDESTAILNFSEFFNETNPATVCLNINLSTTRYRLDSLVRYESTGRVSEFHNIQNFTLTNTSIPQNIILFDLLSSRSQEFVITYKDNSFLPVENALIDITRNYISEGVFKSVEVPKTNEDGRAVAHLVLADVIYTIVVSKEGQVLSTFTNQIATCENPIIEDCTISLNAFESGIQPKDFTTDGNITYSMSFNEATQIITTTFTTTGGSSRTILINTTKFDRLGNDTVCTDTLTSSAGTLTCAIPLSVGNVTVIAQLFSNGDLVTIRAFQIAEDPSDTFGIMGVFLLLVTFLTLPFMFIPSTIAVLISFIVGLVFASVLSIYAGGSVLGAGSALLWFIIAILIVIWKIIQNRRGF